ncbi:MAG TPA: hypothetical protein VKQ52_15740 [Puia sp.]|nr:hypothetical protein [Puia sp.]
MNIHLLQDQTFPIFFLQSDGHGTVGFWFDHDSRRCFLGWIKIGYWQRCAGVNLQFLQFLLKSSNVSPLLTEIVSHTANILQLFFSFQVFLTIFDWEFAKNAILPIPNLKTTAHDKIPTDPPGQPVGMLLPASPC